MKTLFKVLACGLAFFCMSLVPALAGVRVGVDVLWHPRADDDVQVYLHASNVAYPIARDRAVAVYEELDDPHADYPVLAFIAHRAHADIGDVWRYRRRGHRWFNVMVHFGLGPDDLFVRVPHEPGGPHGKAYGYWREHPRRFRARHVRDDDVRFWVGVRTVAVYTGTTPARAFERIAAGERLDRIAGRHFRSKHPRAAERRRQRHREGHHGDRHRRGHDKRHRKDKDRQPGEKDR
ncbi:MAG: hypothetical protein ACE5HU_01770 [Acidobacteriota bacterium]